MADKNVKAVGQVSEDLLKWFTDRSKKLGPPRTALIAMAMHEYRVKTEKEENE